MESHESPEIPDRERRTHPAHNVGDAGIVAVNMSQEVSRTHGFVIVKHEAQSHYFNGKKTTNKNKKLVHNLKCHSFYFTNISIQRSLSKRKMAARAVVYFAPYLLNFS